jgi:hypothetical protein
MVADEWYSSEGELVGFESQTDRIAYWKGRLVSGAAYADSFMRWLPGRDSVAWVAPRRM